MGVAIGSVWSKVHSGHMDALFVCSFCSNSFTPSLSGGSVNMICTVRAFGFFQVKKMIFVRYFIACKTEFHVLLCSPNIGTTDVILHRIVLNLFSSFAMVKN